MIDLHNHILPGLDDGARDLDEALTMAKMAVVSGVALMLATPHRFYRGYEIPIATIMARMDALQGELDDRGIQLRIAPGSEIPISPDAVEGLRLGQLLRLGGPTGTHALMEPPFDRVPHYALPVFEQLVDMGVGIVLAHPERNEEVQRDLAFVESSAALGAVLQVTSGSILGRFGPLAQAAAKEIIQHTDWKVVIASDAHWAHDRTPEHLHAAAETAGIWLGDKERAHWMVNEGPASCLPKHYLPGSTPRSIMP